MTDPFWDPETVDIFVKETGRICSVAYPDEPFSQKRSRKTDNEEDFE